MPDPTRRSVSASQIPALFGASPYLSKWMLFHAFRNPELPIPEAAENTRMAWGNALQEPIMRRAAYDYRAKRLLSNTDARLYVRRGRIGHTRDGRLIGTGRGRINVEAKSVDRSVWLTSWTERAAPQHIEIQAAVGTYVDRCELTVIAALIGGNETRYYERPPMGDLEREIVGQVETFFADVKAGREPDALGIAAELPMLADLYPEANPAKALERLDDASLRDLIKQFEYGADQYRLGKKLIERAKPQILAIAQDCSVIRANSIEARITKSLVDEATEVDPDVLFAAQAVRAWARIHFSEDMSLWPKELRQLAKALGHAWRVVRKAHVSTRITTAPRYGDPEIDDLMDAFKVGVIPP